MVEDTKITSGPDRPLRSYGRRKGRRPTDRQQSLLDAILPRIALDLTVPAPVSGAALFPGATRTAWLEIGFGGGEHLLWQAHANPHVGFIGCEPFLDGIIKVVDGIGHSGLENIRLHAGDAREVLDWLPDASITRAFVLFPDPWPKKRHLKRRIVNRQLLDQLARVLAPGSRLRLATDIDSYARAMVIACERHPAFRWLACGAADWRERPADWPPTKYEKKAIREGRRRYFLEYQRVEASPTRYCGECA